MLTTNLNIRVQEEEKAAFDNACQKVSAIPSEVLRTLMNLAVSRGLEWSPDGRIQLKKERRRA